MIIAEISVEADYVLGYWRHTLWCRSDRVENLLKMAPGYRLATHEDVDSSKAKESSKEEVFASIVLGNPGFSLVVADSSKIVVDVGAFLHEVGIPFKIEREIPIDFKAADPRLEIASFMRRIEELAKQFADVKGLMNDKLGVHLSGNQLLLYNEVSLMENACTNVLQKRLRDGWRIIAVCPQEARRPDYILGRYNQDIN